MSRGSVEGQTGREGPGLGAFQEESAGQLWSTPAVGTVINSTLSPQKSPSLHVKEKITCGFIHILNFMESQ